MVKRNNNYVFINDLNNSSNATVISTQQNANRSKTLVANYNDPIIYDQPQLQIFNDPGGSNMQVQFNTGAGFGGDSNLVYNYANSLLSLRGNLFVTGNMEGKISTNFENFKISGGNLNQIISTDGNGNLFWANIEPSGGLFNGTSNIVIYPNANITFSTAGTPNVVVVSSTGTKFNGLTDLGEVGNVTIAGGEPKQFLGTDGNGNLFWNYPTPVFISENAPNVGIANLWFNSDEGRAYINYDGNSWVDFSPAVLPDPDIYANTITFPDGSVQTTAGGGGNGNYSNANVSSFLPTYVGNIGANLVADRDEIKIYPNSDDSTLAWTFSSNLFGSSNTSALIAPTSDANNVGAIIYPGTNGIAAQAWVDQGPYPNTFLTQVLGNAVYTAAGDIAFVSDAAGWVLKNSGNIVFPDSSEQNTAFTGTATYAGVVTTNAQPNITSVGTLSNLSVTGGTSTGSLYVSQSVNIPSGNANIGGSIDIGGKANIDGNAKFNSNVLITHDLQVNGNINFTGNVTQISGVSGNFYGDINGFGALYAGIAVGYAPLPATVIQATTSANEYTQINFQNIDGGYIASTDYVATADNGNDTINYIDMGIASGSWDGTQENSIGDAASADDGYLYVQGGTGGGNLILGTTSANTGIKFLAGGAGATNVRASLTASGLNVVANVTAGNFVGNGSKLSSITGGNVSGQVANALVAGTVYSATQSNITSVGTLTSLSVSGNISTDSNLSVLGNIAGSNLIISNNATITGNLTVSGTTEYINVTNLKIQDPIIELGGGTNGAPLTNNDGKDRGSLLHYFNVSAIDAFMGWDNSNAEFAFGSNVSVSSEVVTYNNFGNIRAASYLGVNVSVTGNVTGGNIKGDGGNLGNIQGANVSGAVGLATYATTANSVAGANVSGAVSFATTANSVAGSNVSGQVSFAATANNVAVGNVSGLGNIATINKDGNASNILYGNGVFAAITSPYGNSNVATYLGSYGSNTITTTGNVSVGNIIGNGQALTGIAGANVTGQVNYAATANSVAGANVSGAVSYATTANSVAVGNVSGLGNIATINLTGSTSNVLYGNGVFAAITSPYGNSNVATFLASFGSNTISTTGNANVGNLGTGGLITATGNITGGNLIATSNLAVNGGVITTTSSTANVFNATPTTVNIGGGASTGVYIGNSSGVVSLAGNVQGSTNGFAIGYRDIPQVSFTGNATLALTDAGKHYLSTLSTANTLTIPNNNTVAWNVGTAITIVNQGTGAITIAQASGVTLYLAGNATSGNRTLATYGMATILNTGANVWFINGTGVS